MYHTKYHINTYVATLLHNRVQGKAGLLHEKRLSLDIN